MHWIKEVEIAKPIDELMTSRSIVKKDFPDFDKIDAMIASCIENASQHADTLPKKSKCRRAECSEVRPILTRKTNCVHDLCFSISVQLEPLQQYKDPHTCSLQVYRMTMSSTLDRTKHYYQ